MVVVAPRWLWFMLAGFACHAPVQGPTDLPQDAVAPAGPAEANARPERAALPSAERARIERDLRFVAKPRPPASAHHAAVAELCTTRLSSLGFEVEQHVFDGGVNIVGRLGDPQRERVVLSAHYDHVAGCSGADDNASGVAALLEAARVLTTGSPRGNGTFERTLIAACWDREEDGLLGSLAYAKRARMSERADILTAISLDGIAYTDKRPGSQHVPEPFAIAFPDQLAQVESNDHRGDFLAVIGDSDAALSAYVSHGESAGLPIVALPLGVVTKLALTDSQRSDHASFWAFGYPGIIVTDTADYRYPQYHCYQGDDVVELLDLEFLTKVTTVTARATGDLLGITQ